MHEEVHASQGEGGVVESEPGRPLDRGAGLRPSRRAHGKNPNDRRGPSFRPDKAPTRILDDVAIAEIAKIPGVAYVEPTLMLSAYVRVNGHSQVQFITGASVPNASSRFTEFAAGKMIVSKDADEAVVTQRFVEDFGFHAWPLPEVSKLRGDAAACPRRFDIAEWRWCQARAD